MKLKVVNAQEKDLVYVIKDSSPEMNWPCLSEDQVIVIKGDDESWIEVPPSTWHYQFKDNGVRYNLYIHTMKLDGSLTQQEMLDITADEREILSAMIWDSLTGVTPVLSMPLTRS